jgi:hypothetical protein
MYIIYMIYETSNPEIIKMYNDYIFCKRVLEGLQEVLNILIDEGIIKNYDYYYSCYNNKLIDVNNMIIKKWMNNADNFIKYFNEILFNERIPFLRHYIYDTYYYEKRIKSLKQSLLRKLKKQKNI